MSIYRIAIGSPGDAGQPDAIKAAFAEFFSMLIFVFAGQGSGMAYSEHFTYFPFTQKCVLEAYLSPT